MEMNEEEEEIADMEETEEEEIANAMQESEMTFVDSFDRDMETMFEDILIDLTQHHAYIVSYSLEMLRAIFYSNPFLFFTRNRRTAEERMDRSESYWIQKHPMLSDDNSWYSFRSHYRVTRQTFDVIVRRCEQSPEYLGSIVRNGIPVEIQVACVFWRFSNSHFGFRIAEMHLGASAGSYNNFTNRFIDAMIRMTTEFINWPIDDAARARDMAEGFASLGGGNRLQNCTGAMDGKNVVIQKPSKNGNDYIDRKSNASINLLAVCDSMKRFTYVKVGLPGRAHDARVFAGSVLGAKMLTESDSARWCPNNSYIAADAAYPLLRNVMVPYKNLRRNQVAESYFNKVHSSTRQKIEHAFGLLAVRWRFLWKHLYVLQVKKCVKIIFVCCILHNICISL